MNSLHFDKGIQPLSDFRAGAASFIRQINATRRPIVITQRGKAVAVVLDVAEYESMQEKTTNQELIMVLDGLALQNKMGGNVVEMLSKMAEWVRHKNKLYKDIKVFTSQGRLSGIMIMLLWPASALMFYKLNNSYVTVMIETTIGRSLLALSLVLEILGFIMIWKIIKIKIIELNKNILNIIIIHIFLIFLIFVF